MVVEKILGEYSSIGGRIFEGTEREFVVQETVLPEKESTELWTTLSNWQKKDRNNTLLRPQNQMEYRSPCRIGMNVFKPWQKNMMTSR